MKKAIAAKLTTAQETLERDRQELPILQKRFSQPFDRLQTYYEKAPTLQYPAYLNDIFSYINPVEIPLV